MKCLKRRRAHAKKDRKIQLTAELDNLDEGDINRKIKCEQELFKLYSEEADGAIIRAKLERREHLETNTKLFLGLES